MTRALYPVFLLMLSGQPSEPSEEPYESPSQSDPTDQAEDCKEDLEDLKGDMVGLELYLKDKKRYKKWCPNTKWTQPKLEQYKKEPKSYLPKSCKDPEK